MICFDNKMMKSNKNYNLRFVDTFSKHITIHHIEGNNSMLFLFEEISEKSLFCLLKIKYYKNFIINNSTNFIFILSLLYLSLLTSLFDYLFIIKLN